MKKCKECGEEKPFSEFYTYRRDGHITLYARCKPCHREWKDSRTPVESRRRHRRTHRKNSMDKLNALKTAPCHDCGSSYPPHVMDFDHVGENKFTNIAKMVGRYSWAKILEEVSKCELVCSNCHRERTYQRSKLL